MSKRGEISYRIRRCIAETKPEDMLAEWGFTWDDLEDFLRERKWIPCDKSLPDKPGRYLVTIIDDPGEEPTTYVDDYVCGAGWGLWFNSVFNNVTTAWMPAPEPYEGRH